MTDASKIMVSVCVVTYNHEKFITDAIDSILAQQVKFEYEILIGDDNSTDGTSVVVQQYANKHDHIHAFIREENLGLKKNLLDILQRAKGKYVATLEGDDFWIDDYKLAKQVDFLEKNSDYVLVTTNALTFSNENTNEIGLLKKSFVPFDFDTSELMIHNPGSTLTAVFRNGIVKEIPDIFYYSGACDRRLYILLSRHGKCKYLRDVTAAYRFHSESITSVRKSSYKGKMDLELEGVRNAILWNEYLGGEYFQEVEIVRWKNSKTLVQLALSNKDYFSAINYSKWVNVNDLQLYRSKIVVMLLQGIRLLGEYFKIFDHDPLIAEYR